jgi:hypothetical protein
MNKQVLLNSLAVALITTGVLKTEATECRAQVVTSICGSGKMALTFNEKESTFALNNGDVRCWGTDIKISGIMSRVHMLPFDLEGVGYAFSQPYENYRIDGLLVYDSRVNAVHMELNDIVGQHVYNLACDPN